MKSTRPASLHRVTAAVFIAGLLFGTPVAAQPDPTTDRINELERKLQESMRLIENLSSKVRQLEADSAQRNAAAAPPAPAPASTPATAEQKASIDERVSGLEQRITTLGKDAEEHRGVPIHGFADVGYQFNDQGRSRGAALGNLNLYFNPQFGDRVKSLIELTFEVVDDGSLAVDLERLQVGYAFSDKLTLWSGRFHTPFGYWNTATHHGAQLQTSILRPRFIDFEDKGGIVPTHVVGLWGTGHVPAAAGRLAYDLYVGNAPKIELDIPGVPGTGVLDPNLAGSTNHSAIAGGKLAYEFSGGLDGLTLGIHGFRTKVEDNAVPIGRTDVRMLGAFGAYVTDNWEVMSEYYRFGNKNETGVSGTRNSWAGYLQVARRFGNWTPFARIEKTSLDQADNFFSQQTSGQSYSRAALGLRFDVNPAAALKVEFNHTRLTDRQTDRFQEARLQYAVRF